MTKFDELWNAYTDDFETHRQYKHECVNFLGSFANRLIRHLEWKPEKVEFADKSSFVSYHEAMLGLEKYIKPSDRRGWWQFQLAFILSQGPDPFPPFRELRPVKLIIPFSFGKQENVFLVESKVSPTQRQFTVENAETDEFEELGKLVFDAMQARVSEWINWDIEAYSVSSFIL